MHSQDVPVSKRQKPPKSVFFAATIVIFFLALAAANAVGFVPSYSADSKITLSNLPQPSGEQSPAALPERIVIPAIALDLPLQNPATKDMDALTEVLKSGPARYADSARLGEAGNMLVFGHSSRLPVVRNQMYKAFNGISELKEGDTISVYGGGKEYLYRVRSVREGDANEDVIDLSREKGTRLTLVTCNTLGEKTARFVVEAKLVGSS